VVTCKGESLSLSDYPSASSKPQVTGDVSPGPNLPKEKEPPHLGDIGWDRFLLRQFGLQSYSPFPSYKLFDNILAPLSGNTESILLKRQIFSVSLDSKPYLTCLPSDSTRVFSLFL
jgi:hypothetical protein